MKKALNAVAKNMGMRYQQLKWIAKGSSGRGHHDDITVVVVFMEHAMQRQSSSRSELSMQGFADNTGPSNLSTVQENWVIEKGWIG